MHQEIRLHGHIDETIEYFATSAAGDVYSRYFYESLGERLRIFSPGSEFEIGPIGIRHRGNGGYFCEYMFGVDLPLADLAKKDVLNRLVLYGASYREDERLFFSDSTEGMQSYERIFFEGNAVYNYFFFLNGSVSGDLREQQKGILRLLGKSLKRSPFVGAGEDTDLADELFGLLGHKSSLFLIKLIHKKHKIYHDRFRTAYAGRKSIPQETWTELEALAEELGIDKYQQERIHIDVMYKHPDNRRIVDEYKSILIDCNRNGSIGALENARLTRLKTLSVRNNIPSALFYTLDEMLKHDKLVNLEEQDYIAETRQILAGILLQERQIDACIDEVDMIKLLQAKRRASENQDHTFEQILLETGKACDERIRDGADLSLMESFSYIVTYFDRYDNTSSKINQLAFMENVRFSEKSIRSLLGNRRSFNELSEGFFDSLFFKGILGNKYLGQFGRKKIQVLKKGLEEIEEGRRTVQDLLRRLNSIDEEERDYGIVLGHVKERIRNLYSRYNTRNEQEILQSEVIEELQAKGMIEREIPRALFRNVMVNIKKEAYYLHNLLPSIVGKHDSALREDFLDNSGLDRFYVEELERQYFQHNDMDIQDLYQIRKGLSA